MVLGPGKKMVLGRKTNFSYEKGGVGGKTNCFLGKSGFRRENRVGCISGAWERARCISGAWAFDELKVVKVLTVLEVLKAVKVLKVKEVPKVILVVKNL